MVRLEKRSPFGRQLRIIRHQNGDTLESLAEKLGVTKSYLSKVENSHTVPAPQFLKKLSRIYMLPPQEWNFLIEHHRISNIRVKEPKMNENKPTGKPQKQVNVDAAKVPTLYSDDIYIYSNDKGVVVNFGQSVGPPPSPLNIVARIGLSHEHAFQLKEALEKNLQGYSRSRKMEI